jgi:hypothetical protein
VPASFVHRILRGRKSRIRKRADCNAHIVGLTDLRVKDSGSAHRTESEDELGALIADPHVLCRRAAQLKWRSETGKRGEDAPGSSLARKTMTNADAERLTLNLKTQLAAGARSYSRMHWTSLIDLRVAYAL